MLNTSRHPAPPPYLSGPRLLADVGGTNARFALETAPGVIESVAVLPCSEHDGLAAALRSYLAQTKVSNIKHAAVAIANPVDGDQVSMTNLDWKFSIEAVRQDLGFDTFLVVNDFTALAMALPYLTDEQKVQVGGAPARHDSAIGLIGAGTGLGVSGLIPFNGHWSALKSEGGHVTFAPVDEREISILRFAWRQFEHVSAERLLSGDGMELIYRALADLRGVPAAALNAAEISRLALSGGCPICVETIDCFCAMLGTIAGNLGVTLGSLGGIYIGGGIVPRLGDYFLTSSFRKRFEQKGRFVHYLKQMPVFVITAPYPAFLGVAAILSDSLADA